jgi:tetratricopeptide (TPR) repeat protein
MNPEDDRRGTAAVAEVERLIGAGRCDEAEALARSAVANSPAAACLHTQARALAALGTSLLKAGERERATAVLSEAETLARRLGQSANWEEASALFEIGQAWRDGGDAAEALRLWDASVAVVDGKDTARLLATLYRESRDMGLWDRGHRVLGLLPRRRPPTPDFGK